MWGMCLLVQSKSLTPILTLLSEKYGKLLICYFFSVFDRGRVKGDSG